MKIRLIAILSITLLIVVVVTTFFLNQINVNSIRPTKSTDENGEVVGGDKDEYGCIGSAGYSWCEEKQKCLRSWEEPCTTQEDKDKLMIIEKLMQKNEWQSGEIEVVVQRNDGNYAVGLVKEISAPSGGMFFAAKTNDEWNIVWDGNGIVDCESLSNYPNYPTNLIPQCYDSSSETMVTR